MTVAFSVKLLLKKYASSIAYISKGLMIDFTPSRMSVLVSGLILTSVVWNLFYANYNILIGDILTEECFQVKAK